MAESRNFRAEDIGAEILPIITRGVYRNPLDALREYIQNGIDAGAKKIDINISSDTVSIRDNGKGMTRALAENAIRLGISEKNPTKDIGFRGIGIYSAFNICKKLQIFTKTKTSETTVITFDFESIRAKLLAENDRRLKGDLAVESLVSLLEDTISVDECLDTPIRDFGTKVLLIGLDNNVYRKLVDLKAVREYLQAVVPLPFSPDFTYKKAIEKSFKKKDHRTINLSLTIHGDQELLYRPYNNDIFSKKKGIGPRFEPLLSTDGEELGFAWYILNDEKQVLPFKELRGLLVKKFGFSVGDRDDFSKYFPRQVFYKRITGEIIITHPALLPNAARSEFEPSAYRDELYYSFVMLASAITHFAEEHQTQMKANEELGSISPEVFNILEAIPKVERDVAQLLEYSNFLSAFRRRLDTHRETLEKSQPSLLKRTEKALESAQNLIREVLDERRQGKRWKITRRSQQSRKLKDSAPSKAELEQTGSTPRTILELFDNADVETVKEARRFLAALDQELRSTLSTANYKEVVAIISDYIDEGF